MAAALIKYETIDEGQIKDIMEGREPRPPEDWEDTGTDAGAAQSTPEAAPPLTDPASQH
jgi:cell division protease FtsH